MKWTHYSTTSRRRVTRRQVPAVEGSVRSKSSTVLFQGGHTMRRFVAFALVAVGAMTLVSSAHAVPSFTRQTGLTCAQCHVMFGAPVPNFTFTGKKFRMNGYRMPWINDKIEAGKVGAISGKRLSIAATPYLSMRYQSVFAERSRAPGATTWS